jgi:[3-methyl-2-oxobutanoate dehydrogenase (acetyl-transferring)] kinase
MVHAEGGQGLPTPSLNGRSSNGSASSSSNSGSSSDSDFDQAAAADSHLVQTAAAFGNLLSSVSQPQQRYSLAGLGFGLPMSRLYARYFGGYGIPKACR